MKRSRDGWMLLAGLIVLGLTGCDNVDWGGMDAAVVPPPPRGDAQETAAEDAELGPLPDGPVLFYVRADSSGGSIYPIAEITGDSLTPLGAGADADLYGTRFISQHLRRGSEFTLFQAGARIGTLVVSSAEVPRSAVCRRLPVGQGTLELAGRLSGAAEFLALSKQSAPDARPTGFQTEATVGMRRVAPILAERALRARGSQLPGNWQAAMVQIEPFPVSTTGDAAIASTFLVDDELQVGNDTTGYSLFLISVPRPDLTGYDTAYVAYSAYPETGKRAPRVVDFLDWDRDGDAELLLQVYGTNRWWFEAVGPHDGRWSRLFHQQCTESGGALDEAALPPPEGDSAVARPPNPAAAAAREPIEGSTP